MHQPPYDPHGPYAPYAPQAPTANAYAPPGAPFYRQNVFVPPGATGGPLVGPGLRKAKLAVGIAQIVALLGGVALIVAGAAIRGRDADGVLIGAVAIFGIWYMLLFAYGIVNAIWIYKLWSWLPPDQRHTSMWKKYISPGAAVGFMFIPYFNIYWMFVVYLGIAEILERLRVQYPSSKGPAKNLAIVALVVPLVFFPVAPILQYLFAKHVEEMAAEMQSRMPGASMARSA